MSLVGGARNLLSIETRWTMLAPPPSPEHPEYEARWRYLYETYEPAMRSYAHTLLRGMLGPHVAENEAADLVHEYLTQCLDKAWLSREAGAIRSFRKYLKAQLFRRACDYVDRAKAKKRKPPGLAGQEGLQGVRARAIDPAEAALDASLVEIAVDRALATLAENNAEHAEIVRDLRRTAGEGSADLAERLGRPAQQMAVLRHRARKAFAVCLAEELKGLVRSEVEFARLLEDLDPLLP